VNHAVVQEFYADGAGNAQRVAQRAAFHRVGLTWMVLALAALRVIPPGAFVLASSA